MNMLESDYESIILQHVKLSITRQQYPASCGFSIACVASFFFTGDVASLPNAYLGRMKLDASWNANLGSWSRISVLVEGKKGFIACLTSSENSG